MMTNRDKKLSEIPNHIKSYAQRGRAFNNFQQQIYRSSMQQWGLRPLEERLSDILSHASKTELVLEIGFGDGDNLLAMATAAPTKLFIGAEVYAAGVLKLLKGIQKRQLTNIYLYDGDVWELLAALPNHRLSQCYILFPDPWPKRQHHKRRLLQTDFLRILRSKCILGAELIIATDWHDYAVAVNRELLASGVWQFTQPSNMEESELAKRLVVTKFENKGLIKKRTIYQFHCLAC